MARKRLTDRALKALRPAAPGTRFEIMDSDAPGLGIRVTDKGAKTFVLVARFPGSPNPTRRALGEYGVLTLEQARRKAREWHELIRRGVDPRDVEKLAREAESERRSNSFARVADDFARLVLIGPDPKNPLQRTGVDTAHDIQIEFGLRFGDRPIDSITARDILTVVDAAKARGAPYRARNLLAHVRRLFNWAIARQVYGLDRSPLDRMAPSQILGRPKLARDRVLADDELRAVWNAAERIGYPYGPLIHVLILTGARRGEIAEGRWSEIDLPARLWRFPAERMKSKAAHVLPLTPDVTRILEGLPRFGGGEFIFSTTFGRVPISGFAKWKTRLDALAVEELRRPIAPFVVHDIRRTMRTGLSSLPIPDLVRELVIAHARPGLHKVYDQHAYLHEKREALELWQARVREIVDRTTQR